MGNIFKSLFSVPEEKPEAEKQFEIFKYDGIRAMRMGQTDYAIRCFEEALKIKHEPETATFLMNAYAHTHRTDDALRIARIGVETDATNLNARLSRAGLLFQSGRYEEAMDDCRYILEADPSNPLVHLLAGRVRRALNDAEGAIAALTEAIALREDLPDAYLFRAEACYESGRLPEALADADRLIELAPEEESGFLLKGRICEKNGDSAQALECYDRALSLNPYSSETAKLTAQALLRENRAAEAIAFLDDTLELIPGFACGYSLRAEARRMAGDIAGAEADDAAALEISADESEAEEVDFSKMNKGPIY
ncbi:MAG: tetratricopeptide repeat protein [Tannerellaceae bacterium]|jgi:tetratricopeptide (TPR) repeat protein|nr:tetratricopeptide repeat protein [Tannerellaceae bacterium]